MRYLEDMFLDWDMFIWDWWRLRGILVDRLAIITGAGI